MEDKNRITKPHRITMDECKKLCITGVKEVVAFDTKLVNLKVSRGGMLVKGEDLHVSSLSVDKGDLEIDGRIDSINYSDKGKSFINKMFK